MISKGDVFHIINGPGKPYKCHTLAIIEDHIVFKWFGRHKQWWHYEIEYKETIEWRIKRAKERP